MNLPYKQILFWLVIAALLTPFFVNTQTYFPFIITKATIFRLLVEAMLVIWVFWMFRGSTSKTENRISLTPLAKAVLVFGLIIFISALFGVDFYYSFFSGNERMEGIFGIWHFIAFFLIIISTFNYLEIEKILKVQVGIGIVYSVIAILAYSGIGKITAQLTSNRLAGYTGNPSFFAVYLLFNAFLALYFYFRQYNFDKKIFNWWLIPFFLQSFLLFATLTRGSMMGYLAGVIFIALGIIFLKANSQEKLAFRKIAIIFLTAIIALSIFTFAGKNTDFVKNNTILSRFASISLNDPTAKSRLFSAGTAWKSFLQKPLFGWGQENYEAAYTTNFNPEVLKYLPEDFYFDRAHNKPMEVLATNGIFGFLSYLSIFGIAFYFLNQLRKKEGWFLPCLALGGCLIGYFVQNIFIFDFHESYLMFFLVLAFISSISEMRLPRSSEDSLAMTDKNSRHCESANWRMKQSQSNYASEMGNYLIIIAVICLVIFSATQWVINPYLVSKEIMKVGYFMSQGQGEESFQELKKIINNPAFLEDDIVIAISKMYSSYGSEISEEERKKILESLIVLAEQRAEKRPWRFSLVTTKADLETILAQWDKNWLLKAEKSAEMILSRFPYFPQAHLFASKFYLLNGEAEKGKAEAERAIELNPKLPTSYYLLALAYNELEDFEKRDENLIKAAEFNYPFTDKNQILVVINLCAKEKKYEVIEKLYLRAIQIDPDDVSLYTGIAATYAKMHNKEKAIEYAKKAVDINPLAKEAADEFIQFVENEQWEMIKD